MNKISNTILLVAILIFLSRGLIMAQGAWSTISSGTPYSLFSLDFVDSNTGYICGAQGVIRKTINGGATWIAQNINGNYNFDIDFFNSNTGWIASDAGNILRTTNGGTTWLTTNIGTASQYAIGFKSSTEVFSAGVGLNINKSTNGGGSFTPFNPGGSAAYYIDFFNSPTNPNRAWAAADAGKVVYTHNGGTTWNTITISSININDIFFIDENIGWVVGTSGKISKTIDGGLTWSTQTSGTSLSLNSISFYDTNNGWIVGQNGKILRTTNGGATWTDFTSPTTTNLTAVQIISPTLGYAVGENGVMIKYTIVALACTSLSSPLGGATNVATNTNLSWSPSANADGYKLKIGTSLNGGEILNNVNVGNVLTYNPPLNFLYGDTIYVKITPFNSSGDAVSCSTEYFYTVMPTTIPLCGHISIPQNNENNVLPSTDISWQIDSAALGYKITIGTQPNNGSIINNLNVGNSLTFNPSNDLPFNSDIFVKVIPYNNLGEAAACVSEKFTTKVNTKHWSNFGDSIFTGDKIKMKRSPSNELYAVGQFGYLGSGPQNFKVAKYNGSAWIPVGNSISYFEYYYLNDIDFDTLGNIYVVGTEPGLYGIAIVAKWNGTAWSTLGLTTEPLENILKVNVTKNGRVHIMGQFTSISNASGSSTVSCQNIAYYNSGTWYAMQAGIGTYGAMTKDTANNIYVSKTTTVNNLTASLAKWDGTSWQVLNSDVINGNVLDMEWQNDDIYIGGSFSQIGSNAFEKIAKFESNAWSSLGAGIVGVKVNDLFYNNDKLYVGGDFTQAGAITTNNIAVFDGTAWSALDTGVVSIINPTIEQVKSIECDPLSNIVVQGEIWTSAYGRIAKWEAPIQCTQITSPANNAVNVPINSLINWTPVIGASSYKLNIGTSLNGTELINNLNVENVTTYTPINLPYFDTIYVKVTPFNQYENAMNCSGVSFITIQNTSFCDSISNGNLTLHTCNGMMINTDIGKSLSYINGALHEDYLFSGVPLHSLVVKYTKNGSVITKSNQVSEDIFDIVSDSLLKLNSNQIRWTGSIENNFKINRTYTIPSSGNTLEIENKICNNTPNLISDIYLQDKVDFDNILGCNSYYFYSDVIENKAFNISTCNSLYNMTWQTNDPVNSKASFSNFSELDPIYIYNNPIDPNNSLLDATTDLVYSLGTLNPGQCKTVNSTSKAGHQIPDCSHLTNPVNNQQNVQVFTDLNWTFSPLATGYKLKIGTSPNGGEILNNVNLGNVLTYNPPSDLPFNDTIFIKITPYSQLGDNLACLVESFNTEQNILPNPVLTFFEKDKIKIKYTNSINPATATSSNLVITGSKSGKRSGTYAVSNDTIVFTPTNFFKAGENIHITSKSNIAYTNGNAAPSYSWQRQAKSYNQTNGKFVPLSTNISLPTAATTYGYASTMVDMNNDGLQDIVYIYIASAGASTQFLIYLQTSANVFASPLTYSTTTSYPNLLGTPDLNNDGYPDLVLSHNVPSLIEVRLNNGSGGLNAASTYAVTNFCNGAKIVDMDKDGDLDIIAYSGNSSISSNSISLLKNNGSGIFAAQVTTNTSVFGSSLVPGDLDNDGDFDLLYTSNNAFSSPQTFRVYKNDGSGGLTLQSSESNPTNKSISSLASLNVDNNLDVICNGPTTQIYKNNTGLTYTLLTGDTTLVSQSAFVMPCDVDGDGDIDIFMPNISNGSTYNIGHKIAKNTGSGSFTMISDTLTMNYISFNDVVDYDNDGDVDHLYRVGPNIYIALNDCSMIKSISNANSPLNGTYRATQEINIIGNNISIPNPVVFDAPLVIVKIGSMASNTSNVIVQKGGCDFTTVPSSTIGSITYGGQTYATKLMPDGKWWMTENLNIGTMITGATNMTNNSVIEKYCYNNDAANCTTYGGLYQWEEMMQYTTTAAAQGICPTGWHLPTDAEWTALEDALPSPDKGSRLAGNGSLWTNGVLDQSVYFNTSGFIALPAGHRLISGSFSSLGNTETFWSSSEASSGLAWFRVLYYNDTVVGQNVNGEANGSSVRCVKD